MTRLKFLIEKEFKQILRNPLLPRLIIMMPLMTMLLLPWAATMEIRNIQVAVVDNDHSPLSRRLTDKVASSAYFHVVSLSASYNQAIETIERGDADVILEIPNDFQKNVVNRGTATVLVAANAVNGMQGSLGGQYIGATISGFAADLQAENPTLAHHQQIDITQRYLFNPYLDSKAYMIPALMVMLLSILCGFIPTLNIVSEKEKGTIEQINVSPVGKFSFILAKLIPIWIISFICLTICLVVAWLLYDVTPAGSFGTIYAAALIFACLFGGAGLVVSNHSSTMQQAIFLMFFFMIIFQLTSGLFTPVSSMPVWMQHVTAVNPLKYFIEIMRMVYLKGSSFSELLPQFGALTGFAIIFGVWAIVSYRKQG